jgi:thiamine monophosphate kinase
LILGDSDDYELILTCVPDYVENIRSVIKDISDIPVTEIGRITEAEKNIQLLFPDGRTESVAPSGWNHFKT